MVMDVWVKVKVGVAARVHSLVVVSWGCAGESLLRWGNTVLWSAVVRSARIKYSGYGRCCLHLHLSRPLKRDVTTIPFTTTTTTPIPAPPSLVLLTPTTFKRNLQALRLEEEVKKETLMCLVVARSKIAYHEALAKGKDRWEDRFIKRPNLHQGAGIH
ncbi:hypothetical protein E2C01_011682 [Portunus trituberculatus]|uniref:Uncharacterized protein n=1 Tax=Portunus trituberculatus TaxID=210409 RepID=A0A5B7DC39_PORTR|nr:hypothetical protein [Portunus trituberculatus]